MRRIIFKATTVDHADASKTIEKVLANVAYSWETVKMAAQLEQRVGIEWAQDKTIQSLKFTNMWISGFLRRNNLRRIRNTAMERPRPSVEAVATRMREIQMAIKSGPVPGVLVGYNLDEVINADETAFHYAQSPTHQLVPSGVSGIKRGRSSKHTDEKLRFTAVIWATAAGTIGPSFNIIKCASKKHDLRGTRVLDTVHAEHGFTAKDGWTKKVWSRTIEMTRKGKLQVEHHVRPYLIHTDGSVITTQHKAYMDTCVLGTTYLTCSTPCAVSNLTQPPPPSAARASRCGSTCS